MKSLKQMAIDKAAWGHGEPRGRVTTTWELWTYDVLGNDRDGWQVNDRCNLSRAFEIVSERIAYNVGRTAECVSDVPSTEEIRRALVNAGYLKPSYRIETDGDDCSIEVTQASNGYPLFGLNRERD
jgi:hypothetical protein